MDTSSIPFKQCTNKENCVQFGQQGWLPATVEYFPKDIRYRYGVKSRCRECLKAYERQHAQRPESKAKRATARQNPEFKQHKNEYQRQPDRVQYLRDWLKTPNGKRYIQQRAHNRRAKLIHAEGTHTTADIALLFKTSKGRCWWCGKPVGNEWHLDHRIPLARGGSNAPENLCVSCSHCNISKSDKLPQEWNGRLL